MEGGKVVGGEKGTIMSSGAFLLLVVIYLQDREIVCSDQEKIGQLRQHRD
jgi:hypothetical protein